MRHAPPVALSLNREHQPPSNRTGKRPGRGQANARRPRRLHRGASVRRLVTPGDKPSGDRIHYSGREGSHPPRARERGL